MLVILNVAFPVFALILIGYVCRKRQILGGNAATEINRYVVYLALPALMFLAAYNLHVEDFAQPAYMAVFAIGMVGIFMFMLVLRLRQKASFVEAAIEGMGACYANIGFMGIPLCMLAFGNATMGAAAIATVMTAGVLFAATIVVIEVQLHAGVHIGHTLIKVGKSLLRNPLIVAPVLGLVLSLTELHVPAGVLQVVQLLGNSAGPCALVALGLFLAQTATSGKVASRAANLAVFLKLIVHPAVTAWLAYYVFDLPRMLADTALLLSALPIGTGPFMLAEKYGQGALVASRAILLSTIGSLFTVSAILVWITSR
jgi:malonate transporter